MKYLAIPNAKVDEIIANDYLLSLSWDEITDIGEQLVIFDFKSKVLMGCVFYSLKQKAIEEWQKNKQYRNADICFNKKLVVTKLVAIKNQTRLQYTNLYLLSQATFFTDFEGLNLSSCYEIAANITNDPETSKLLYEGCKRDVKDGIKVDIDRVAERKKTIAFQSKQPKPTAHPSPVEKEPVAAPESTPEKEPLTTPKSRTSDEDEPETEPELEGDILPKVKPTDVQYTKLTVLLQQAAELSAFVQLTSPQLENIRDFIHEITENLS